ncbi:MAG: haloacid dehalogenase-like hydrolase, partial [Bacteroidales bacterium]|nr:haloacid dehalogenase-like hydrolase [Bacteroidales bacterium]
VFISSCDPAQQGETDGTKYGLTADPLPSWNDGETKQAILDFVASTTTEGTGDFVPVSDRIACFDNDGTLWSEQPIYAQFMYAIDRVKILAPQHPEWKTKQPFKAVLDGDVKTALRSGEKALLEMVAAIQGGLTTDAFAQSVTEWIDTARHPVTGRRYTEMTFQPMLELLQYLRANGYKTFIVSGGGIDFMRPWTEETYGISPDQVVGSSYKVKYEVVDGSPGLIKLTEINFVDDKEGKPVGIYQYIGKRPVFTAGNSDGDYAMLQWTSTGPGPRFGLIVHHTDSIREVAYDSLSSIGHLQKGLNDAAKYNWVVVDMKEDWKEIFPPLD